MAECIVCKAETFVQVGAVPICIPCLETQAPSQPRNAREIRAALVKKIVDATVRANAAMEVFGGVTTFPSGLPHPDGVQRIKSAAGELSIARKELMAAHKRLNQFLENGIVPEDLKATRG